jgi:hypothetical protein
MILPWEDCKFSCVAQFRDLATEEYLVGEAYSDAVEPDITSLVVRWLIAHDPVMFMVLRTPAFLPSVRLS